MRAEGNEQKRPELKRADQAHTELPVHHGGDVYRNRVRLDFSVSINPMGPPESALKAYRDSELQLQRYPDPEKRALKEVLAEAVTRRNGRNRDTGNSNIGNRSGENRNSGSGNGGNSGSGSGAVVTAEQFLPGNGASELLMLSVLALQPERVLLLAPSFSGYRHVLRALETVTGKRPEVTELFLEDVQDPDGSHRFSAEPALREAGELLKLQAERQGPGRLAAEETAAKEAGLQAGGGQATGGTLVLLCTPNNPTGGVIPRQQILHLLPLVRRAGARLLLDECFLSLTPEGESESLSDVVLDWPELLIVSAFTKAFAMPGLRAGWLQTSDQRLLERICRLQPEWSLSVPAEAACVAALKEEGYLEASRALVRKNRRQLEQGLEALGLTVYRGEANFILFCREEERKRAAETADMTAAAAAAGPKGTAEGGPDGTAAVGPDGAESRETLGDALLKQGILIRETGDFRGLGPGFYRAAVRTEQENRELLEAISAFLKCEVR